MLYEVITRLFPVAVRAVVRPLTIRSFIIRLHTAAALHGDIGGLRVAAQPIVMPGDFDDRGAGSAFGVDEFISQQTGAVVAEQLDPFDLVAACIQADADPRRESALRQADGPETLCVTGTFVKCF